MANYSSSKHALVLLADSDYLDHTRQVFYSARKYGNWKGRLVLLAFEVKDRKALSWFEDREIEVVHISHETFSFTGIEVTRAVYFAKIYLFHPVWSRFEKIIYLDTDMIIRKDITGLLKFDRFAAADDCFQYSLIHQFSPPGKPYEDAEINNHFPQKMLTKLSFNSGLMVIPSANNNKKEYSRLLELTNTFGKYSIFFDQGVLNLHFINSRFRIPYVFNDYFVSEHFNRRGLLHRKNDKDAVILHLIHPYKPWDPKCEYHGEWKRRTDDAFTGKLPPGLGKKPSRFSIRKVDLVNQLSIMEIYAKGAVINNLQYLVWRAGRLMKDRLPFLYQVIRKR